MRQLFALLVGIDSYTTIPPLRGCVADIDAYEDYLVNRIDGKSHALQICVLKEEAATTAAVSTAFGEHLGKAGPGDTALFVFSGHGSQHVCSAAESKLEPDYMNESLVCYDSRLPGGSDLVDKQIAANICKLADRGAHVVVILDCCHSGSGTRFIGSLQSRSVPPRAPETQSRISTALKREGGGWASPVGPRHVLLAACRDHEHAFERPLAEGYAGVFSTALMNALNNSPITLSYSSLFQMARTWVRRSSYPQDPQLEAYDPSDLDLRFLGEPLGMGRQRLSVDHDPVKGWMLNLGEIHGISDVPGHPLTLLLFRRGTHPQTRENALGRAVVSEVQVDASLILLDFIPDRADNGFEAVVELLPVPPVTLDLSGDEGGIVDIRKAIATATAAGPSPWIKEVAELPLLCVRAETAQYEICRAGEHIPLLGVRRESPSAASATVFALEHIARWLQIRDQFDNPTSPVNRSEFEFIVRHAGAELVGPDISLFYDEETGELGEPAFSIEIRNNGARTLHFALLVLTESFGVVPLLEEGSARLEPGQSLHPRGGREMRASVPRSVLERGGTTTTDIVRLIIASCSFDARVLAQPNLGTLFPRSAAVSGLNREITPLDDRSLASDWRIDDLSVTTTRHSPWRLVDNGELELMPGLTLILPPGVRCRARLNSGVERGMSRPTPGFTSSHEDPISLFRFLEPCGADPGLAALELDSIVGAELVTRNHPVRLQTPIAIEHDEQVVPTAFGYNSAVPLGTSAVEDGCVTIIIDELPIGSENTSESVNIVFYKLTRLRPLTEKANI